MTHFGIQNSTFSNQINIGLIDPHRHRFLDGSDIVDEDADELHPGMVGFLSEIRHEDHTDRALRVVADHVLGDRTDGALVVEYKDCVTYEITVRKTTSVPGEVN